MTNIKPLTQGKVVPHRYVTMADIMIPSQQVPLRKPVVAADGDSSDSDCVIVDNRPGVPLTQKGQCDAAIATDNIFKEHWSSRKDATQEAHRHSTSQNRQVFVNQKVSGSLA